jgi:hypothetical protein
MAMKQRANSLKDDYNWQTSSKPDDGTMRPTATLPQFSPNWCISILVCSGPTTKYYNRNRKTIGICFLTVLEALGADPSESSLVGLQVATVLNLHMVFPVCAQL